MHRAMKIWMNESKASQVLTSELYERPYVPTVEKAA
jgi:hypothetical protein